jgi:hypothetical protein
VQLTAYRIRAFGTVPAPHFDFSIVEVNLRGFGRWVMNLLKETNGVPKSCSDVANRRNAGSSKHLWVHDDRAIVVVAGVTTCLRSAGKRHTGQRVAGETFLYFIELEGREMRKSSLTLNARRCFLWRAGYLETRLSGLGKGSWKRADDQSTGTGTVRFNHSRQPFW